MSTRSHTAAAAAMLLAFAVTDLHAQATEPESAPAAGTLEEIVVTARRRGENLQETPVAVSAIGEESLAEAGVSSIQDLEQLVPGLQFGESGSRTPAIFIRGIGQREGSAVLDPGVGVYLNGIFLARQDTQLLDTVDTQSVQVLRGPQGTLFGKNNTGGAMLVTTKEPSSRERELTAALRFGAFDRRDFKLSGNLPLVENAVGMRFALNFKHYDGYIDNIVDGDTFEDEERLAAAVRIRWDVSDDLSADLFGYWSRQRENGTALTCLFQNPQSNLSQLHYPGQPSFESKCRESESIRSRGEIALNSESSALEMQSALAALTLEWNVAGLDVKNIAAWSHQFDIERNDDQDGTRIPILSTGTSLINGLLRADGERPIDERRMQLSDELQVNSSFFAGRLKLTTGIFVSLETIEANPFASLVGPKGLAGIDPSTLTDAVIPGLPDLGDAVVLPLATLIASSSDLDNKSGAVFAQGSFDATDWLQLTLGGRFTIEHRERDLTVYQIDYAEYGTRIGSVFLDPLGFYAPMPRVQFDALGANLPDLPIIVQPSADVRSEQWIDFSPAATLSLIAPENWLRAAGLDSALSYFTYSQGFKAGGFEPRGPELVPFEPEKVTNYELGLKVDALDRRLRVNAAIYHMDYKDIQVRVAEQGARISDIYLFLSNAAGATIQGAELEMTLLLGNWMMNATGNYTDASYDEFAGQIVIPGQGSSVVDRSREPFGLVPKKSFSLAVQYNWATEWGVVVPRLQGYYRDEVFTGLDYLAIEYPSATIDSFAVLNGRLGYAPNDRIHLAAYVDNITDEEYYKSGFSVSAALGGATLVQGPPRVFGFEASYRF